MAANVETMFYNYENREKPWHGLGTPVEGALTSKEALVKAGLDWEVESKPIFDSFGNPIPSYFANTRSSDNSVLGIVTGRYSIVQNKEAFDFTDSIVGEELKYETAGSLNNGKQIWLLGKMPKTTILGDDVEPYICFTNSHDGKGAVRVCMTPVRVVCNNTLNFALDTAKRTWSTRHTGDINAKLLQAQTTLELANVYMYDLGKYAEQMANTKVDMDKTKAILDTLFPINEDDSNRKQENNKKLQEDFMMCYIAPDIQQYMGTAWGMLNAVSDMATHCAPNRLSSTYAENNFGKVLGGHTLMDNMASLLNA